MSTDPRSTLLLVCPERFVPEPSAEPPGRSPVGATLVSPSLTSTSSSEGSLRSRPRHCLTVLRPVKVVDLHYGGPEPPPVECRRGVEWVPFAVGGAPTLPDLERSCRHPRVQDGCDPYDRHQNHSRNDYWAVSSGWGPTRRVLGFGNWRGVLRSQFVKPVQGLNFPPVSLLDPTGRGQGQSTGPRVVFRRGGGRTTLGVTSVGAEGFLTRDRTVRGRGFGSDRGITVYLYRFRGVASHVTGDPRPRLIRKIGVELGFEVLLTFWTVGD